MSRYIDADAVLRELKSRYPSMPFFKELREKWAIRTEGYIEAEKIIWNAPTIDVVSVVRCKDCWHGKQIDSADGVFTHMCDISDLKWRADDYCSYGERRES